MSDKTREEQLAHAQAEAEKAAALLNDAKTLHQKMLKSFPPRITLGMTKKQEVKAKSFFETMRRLESIIMEPGYLRDHFASVDLDTARRSEKEQQAQVEQQRTLEIAQLQEEAVIWLIERGKKLGTDFTLSNALKTANDLAFDEAVLDMSNGVEYHDFYGKNCDDCLGWDGISRRCACGNRRVYWTPGNEHSFKNPQLVAEAW